MPNGDEVGRGQVISYLPSQPLQRVGSPELWAGVFLQMLRMTWSISASVFPNFLLESPL